MLRVVDGQQRRQDGPGCGGGGGFLSDSLPWIPDVMFGRLAHSQS